MLSVVSVYHNRADLVAASLASVLGQTHADFELIVVDDGSTDDTWRELQKIVDPRVRTVRHENRGFVGSIRRAVDMCRGDFVAVHGSGDLSHPDRLARQLAAMGPGTGVVGCWLENRNLDKGFSKVYRPAVAANASEDICASRFQIHGGVMFRRSVYEDVGGYREAFPVGQDHDLWLRMSERSEFRVVPDVLYTRFIRGDGVGGGDPERRFRQIMLFNLAVHSHRCRMAGRPDPVDTHSAESAPYPVTRESAKILALLGMELAAAGKPDKAAAALLRGASSPAPALPIAVYLALQALRGSRRMQSAAFRGLIRGWYGLKAARTG